MKTKQVNLVTVDIPTKNSGFYYSMETLNRIIELFKEKKVTMVFIDPECIDLSKIIATVESIFIMDKTLYANIKKFGDHSMFPDQITLDSLEYSLSLMGKLDKNQYISQDDLQLNGIYATLPRR